MPNQQEIRKAIIAQRHLLSPAQITEHSSRVCQQLLNLPEFIQSENIAMYYSVAAEIQTDAISKACWQLQKNCYLPILQPNFQMTFGRYQADTKLTLNSRKIAEPLETELISADKLDLVLLPLVAFDANCHRIGHGAGYYDRYFADTKAPALIGLAHALQQVPAIEPNPWDIRLNIIITEKQIFKLY